MLKTITLLLGIFALGCICGLVLKWVDRIPEGER